MNVQMNDQELDARIRAFLDRKQSQFPELVWLTSATAATTRRHIQPNHGYDRTSYSSKRSTAQLLHGLS